MPKKTIAIDIDDVLAEHAQALVDFSNKMYGTHLTIEDYNDHWSVMWQVDKTERECRAEQFLTPENIKGFGVVFGADQGLRKLSKHYNLALVTARPPSMLEMSKEWLNSHYPDIDFKMHFIALWEDKNAPSKADICKKIDAEYLIDDLPGHCNIAAEGGIKALLFGDYAWNRKEEVVDGVVRVHDWQEVLEYFDAQG